MLCLRSALVCSQDQRDYVTGVFTELIRTLILNETWFTRIVGESDASTETANIERDKIVHIKSYTK